MQELAIAAVTLRFVGTMLIATFCNAGAARARAQGLMTLRLPVRGRRRTALSPHILVN